MNRSHRFVFDRRTRSIDRLRLRRAEARVVAIPRPDARAFAIRAGLGLLAAAAASGLLRLVFNAFGPLPNLS
ncbi:MAG: hypothetical protein SFX72_16570 [Isosphaeraceae bacterium]|nr:hypothetical protein [Isosphaeraceae bacterium]